MIISPKRCHRSHEVRFRLYLYIFRLTMMRGLCSGANLIEMDWTLFHSGVVYGKRHQAGVGMLVDPQLGGCRLGFTPVNRRVASLCAQVGDGS